MLLLKDIGAAKLNTVVIAFGDAHLQRMIGGVRLPDGAVDAAEIRIEPLAGGFRRKKITRGSERGKNHVEIVLPVGLVYAARAHITKRRHQASSKLLLQIEIPLHDVIALWLLFGVAARATVELPENC